MNANRLEYADLEMCELGNQYFEELGDVVSARHDRLVLTKGWRLTITEANARGTPVIAHDVPVVRDAVVSGQNGLLVEPDNVQEMARLSCALLEDPARRMRLTKSAIDFARQFSWDTTATAFMKLAEDAANNRIA